MVIREQISKDRVSRTWLRTLKTGYVPMNFPCWNLARYADFILTDTSAEYISFRILRNGVMSIADLLSVSTPSLTAIYLTLCSGKKAHVVREIFDLALAGNGLGKIRKHINSQHVLRPAAYAAEQGATGYERYFEDNEENRYIWSENSLRNILRSPSLIYWACPRRHWLQYTSHYALGKRLPDIIRSQGNSSPDGINLS